MKIKELYDRVNDGTIISDIELQREIIYDTEKQRLVIDSIVNDIPLPAFYFWKNEDGILEVLDGKQRIEAIKKFYQNDLMYNGKLYKQTDKAIQDKISNTEIKEIISQGDEQLKREIFRRINTLGVPLNEYEVLNGLYHGEYLRGLTVYCEQDKKAKKVLGKADRGGAKIRLLRLLGEIRGYKGKDGLNDYVKAHQYDGFATDQKEIKKYIDFIADVFDSYSILQIQFELALKYYKDISIWKSKSKEINSSVKAFLKSDDAKILANRKAREIEDIIQAIVNNLSVDPKRLFTKDDKIEVAKRETPINGKYRCKKCNQLFLLDELEVDHIIAWSKGGRTVLSNAELLCKPCNIKKNNS